MADYIQPAINPAKGASAGLIYTGIAPDSAAWKAINAPKLAAGSFADSGAALSAILVGLVDAGIVDPSNLHGWYKGFPTSGAAGTGWRIRYGSGSPTDYPLAGFGAGTIISTATGNATFDPRGDGAPRSIVYETGIAGAFGAGAYQARSTWKDVAGSGSSVTDNNGIGSPYSAYTALSFTSLFRDGWQYRGTKIVLNSDGTTPLSPSSYDYLP